MMTKKVIWWSKCPKIGTPTILLLIKWRDYLQNVQYINKIQQYQSDYDAGIVDY